MVMNKSGIIQCLKNPIMLSIYPTHPLYFNDFQVSFPILYSTCQSFINFPYTNADDEGLSAFIIFFKQMDSKSKKAHEFPFCNSYMNVFNFTHFAAVIYLFIYLANFIIIFMIISPHPRD